MKKTLLCLLIMVLFCAQDIYAKAGAIAKVKLIKGGKVYYKIKGSKKFKELKINRKLTAGTIIKTTSKSKVTLALKGGSLVEVKENSKIIINKELMKKSSLQLLKGKAGFKIKKILRGKGGFNVYTPTAVVGVRGTEYEVAVASDGSSAINVADGKVAVGNGKTEASLTKGQSAEASVDNSDISKSDKNIDTEKWNKDKNKEIEKQPLDKMNSINKNLAAAEQDQKKTVDNLSAVKEGDQGKAGKDVEAGLFNQCKNQGLYEAARSIKNKNKDNEEIRESYKSIKSLHGRLNKLNKLLEEKFARLDKIFEEKEKELDKKMEDAEKRLEEKFKSLKFDDDDDE